jgi:hypothetical protein
MHSKPPASHLAFADESNFNTGRFRAVAVVSLPAERYQEANQSLFQLLADSNVREFKWKKLRGAQERFAACKLISWAVTQACTQNLRIDVLTWDTEDRRHAIQGRDDVANLHRMYYHLFRVVLSKRWPAAHSWALHPDEQTAVNWNAIHEFLDYRSVEVEVRHDLFHQNQQVLLDMVTHFNLRTVEPRQSHLEPLIQLADLFAGLCIYSRLRFADYDAWVRQNGDQIPLFGQDDALTRLTSADRERFPVLREFNKLCKQRRLGVSLNTRRGLYTPNPAQPINFWWYIPQHEQDKAPIRSSDP